MPEEEYIPMPITDERIKPGSIILWSGMECVVEEKSPQGEHYTHMVYKRSNASWNATMLNGTQISVKREEGGETA